MVGISSDNRFTQERKCFFFVLIQDILLYTKTNLFISPQITKLLQFFFKSNKKKC